uniref:Tyrosyl-DNA phosphodiesterase 2 n=2 Tax=Araneus ventricosus TaxID=182803 RepID=A0A4Y2KD35_ARAVE|nr:Tyrosyl-DNA phosphodiesterase 2 [Araneus ventricosus]GBM99486.1 Tyrosyl-DNA phosphodiesterase 2 [Araneus ventricosus]
MSSDDREGSENNSEVAVASTSAEELNSDTKTKSVLKFITWNTDGLHREHLIPRAEAVCRTILNEQADIVFLQEVVPQSAEYFRNHLTDYQCLFGNEEGYFIGTLFKKSTVSYKGSQIIDFPTTMARNCLKVNVGIVFLKNSINIVTKSTCGCM